MKSLERLAKEQNSNQATDQSGTVDSALSLIEEAAEPARQQLSELFFGQVARSRENENYRCPKGRGPTRSCSYLEGKWTVVGLINLTLRICAEIKPPGTQWLIEPCSSRGRGRCSVAQTTGITVAAEFENFEQSDPGK